jgi:tetratricopeptide (TPR) repeat protein
MFRWLIKSARFRRHAKISIGDEVSIKEDRGARLAYKGIYAFLNSEYSKSLKHLEEAMKYSMVSHNSSFCLDWMAQCYDALEKPKDSLRCCVRAVEVEPSNIKALFNLADAYVRNGSFAKAEFYYNRILRYDSKNASASFMLGTLFMGRGQYDEAHEQFLKTLEIDERSTAAMAELSVVCAIKGEYSDMDGYYEKIKDKKNVEADRLRKRLNSIKRVRELCNDS